MSERMLYEEGGNEREAICQLTSKNESVQKKQKTRTLSNQELFSIFKNRQLRWEVEIAHQSKFYNVRSTVKS